jgi:hypothetical protein
MSYEFAPTRADFNLGDSVGFEGHDLIRHAGTIVLLNQKTATGYSPRASGESPTHCSTASSMSEQFRT